MAIGVISILMLLIIFTTVGFVFAWMVHLMAKPPVEIEQETGNMSETNSSSV